MTTSPKEIVPIFLPEKKKNPSDKELIEYLKEECRRVKIQRNEYEQKLMTTTRELNRVQSELKLLENYINRSKSNQGA